MQNTLILLAGYPGTGKTFLANLIMERLPKIHLLSPDSIKESNWDQFGFNNLDEKETLIAKSWQDYFKEMENLFRSQVSIISDYPFSDKQKGQIEFLTDQYGYQVITIRLIADLDVLFERQKSRDLGDRHLGHILKQYHKGIGVQHDQADNLVNYEEFIQRCITRGYDTFSLGILFEIDVTDFSTVNYTQLLIELEKLIKK